MDRQTLRDWVHRYNAEGIAGLVNRRAPGPAPRLSAEQEVTVERWVEEGPSLERDGVVRWRCVDLQDRIAREFAVTGLRQMAMEQGHVLAANAWGKVKTVLQIAMVLALITVDGSPAWNPQATFALVTTSSTAASSPSRHRPKDSPTSALRSTRADGEGPVAFRRRPPRARGHRARRRGARATVAGAAPGDGSRPARSRCRRRRSCR